MSFENVLSPMNDVEKIRIESGYKILYRKYKDTECISTFKVGDLESVLSVFLKDMTGIKESLQSEYTEIKNDPELVNLQGSLSSFLVVNKLESPVSKVFISIDQSLKNPDSSEPVEYETEYVNYKLYNFESTELNYIKNELEKINKLYKFSGRFGKSLYFD